MENDGYTAVQIERCHPRQLLVVSVLIASLFAMGIGAGLDGPQVFQRNDFRDQHDGQNYPVRVNQHTSEGNATVDGQVYEVSGMNLTVDRMQPRHQMLYMHVELEKPPALRKKGVEMKFQQVMLVSAKGYSTVGVEGLDWNAPPVTYSSNSEHIRTITCVPDKDFCQPTRVFFKHFIDHDTYDVEVKFIHTGTLYYDENGDETEATEDLDDNYYNANLALIFVSTDYTDFEMTYKYLFLSVTVLVAFLPRYGYFSRLRAVYSKVGKCWCLGGGWTWQQRWVALLLVLLLLFNDPLFAVQIYSDVTTSCAVLSLWIVSVAGFLSSLLCFWLSLLTVAGETTHHHDHGRRKMSAFLPHIALCMLIFACLVTVYVFERFHDLQDPSYSAPEDFARFYEVYVTGIILTAAYSLWLLLLVLRCFREACRMAPCFRFLFGLTLSSVVIVLVGLYLNALSPLQSSAVNFIGFYMVCNLYVWTLAFAYAPYDSIAAARSSGGSEAVQAANPSQEAGIALQGLQARGHGLGFGVRSGHIKLDDEAAI